MEELDTVRQPWFLLIVYTCFYAFVFVLGLIGNVFVLLAVVFHPQLRTTTDYMISSLALADLLIIFFCLPTTLLNNLLTEWQLGAIGCKLSTFINSTTSCASIFTLVAVTADRYLAICHTLKYAIWQPSYTLYVIFAIWITSAVLASPNLVLYDEVIYDLDPPNGTLVARLCVSKQDSFLHFIVVNLIIAFILPVILISVSYALIFITVSNHRSLAVDARIRDERVKLRVAQMMLTVIIVFMLCWTPLYGLYCYFFLASNRNSSLFHFASSVLRPIFQWLSLLSSSINPLIYIGYSQKYRRAFHRLLLLPCQMKYANLRTATRNTFRLSSAEKNSKDEQQKPTINGTNGNVPNSKRYTILAQPRKMTPTVAAAWPVDAQRRASQPPFYSSTAASRNDANDLLNSTNEHRVLLRSAITPPPHLQSLLAPPIDLYGPISSC
ncbi:G-PROTEIN-RECEP-F1-2 domain-containing protein [Aphelenchoides besseyi]|nr:G-PROTEIN-RECEP-F1-2 domain-containing protein [Aphelenchoides besseyi]KAI6202347.1 G-PROTEIN-RECEP-F1-2 domain-containing protein [Aphelenchoides besseyi]